MKLLDRSARVAVQSNLQIEFIPTVTDVQEKRMIRSSAIAVDSSSNMSASIFQ